MWRWPDFSHLGVLAHIILFISICVIKSLLQLRTRPHQARTVIAMEKAARWNGMRRSRHAATYRARFSIARHNLDTAATLRAEPGTTRSPAGKSFRQKPANRGSYACKHLHQYSRLQCAVYSTWPGSVCVRDPGTNRARPLIRTGRADGWRGQTLRLFAAPFR